MSQENNTVKTLTELANAEALGRPDGVRAVLSEEMKRVNALPDEEKAREMTIIDNRHKLRSVIHDFFRESVNRAARPMNVLIVPDMIAHHHVLGSNAAMRLVVAKEPENTEHVGEFLTVMSSLLQYPPQRMALAQKLAHKYGEKSRTLGECYWLFELCSFLGIGSSFFGNVLSEVMFGKDVVLEDLDFTKIMSPQRSQIATKEEMLFDLATKQYMELEAFLSRM